jgi:hypothetical protein
MTGLLAVILLGAVLAAPGVGTQLLRALRRSAERLVDSELHAEVLHRQPGGAGLLPKVVPDAAQAPQPGNVTT